MYPERVREDTTSGVGGWGDPNDDDQITDGAFTDGFIVSYDRIPHLTGFAADIHQLILVAPACS